MENQKPGLVLVIRFSVVQVRQTRAGRQGEKLDCQWNAGCSTGTRKDVEQVCPMLCGRSGYPVSIPVAKQVIRIRDRLMPVSLQI
jgi:hypothetical protein